MNYLLLVSGDSSTWGSLPADEARAEQDAFAAFEREASEAGVLVDRAPLEPDAWTFSVRDGRARLREGPPTGDGRRIGCFYVLDCEDIAAVSRWAAKIPLVGPGGFDEIEIRPVMTTSG